ncbi:hypothetical protein CMI37_09260 [Candidatus Pacearchaeota archaeon]|nr:hypothetical protein [Candidatus Pacearchaeota archaeon]
MHRTTALDTQEAKAILDTKLGQDGYAITPFQVQEPVCACDVRDSRQHLTLVFPLGTRLRGLEHIKFAFWD